MPMINVCEVPEGERFRWRPHKLASWEEYTIVGWDSERQAPTARCQHGYVNQFNPCADVQYPIE